MRMITVANDGTTTVELTDGEAHALRDILGAAAKTGNDPAWTLHRLLAHAHGEED
ncbi:hypothetical protein [Streptomyces sp. NBC_01530]|uniref:hypothetical protein n=1 Tax=Streptomyces sp. NBC_01530 TaxID=2903895 RepID=UPI00386FFC39